MFYFKKYLQISPAALALWRGQEADALEGVVLESPLIDIGCGFGEFGGVFFEGQVEIGVDINLNDLRMAAEKEKYKWLFWTDARNLPFGDEIYQTVLSISVLEHIVQVEKVFKEAYRILKPGGKLIFTVPTDELNKHLLGARWLKTWGLINWAEKYLHWYHKAFKHEVIIPKTQWLAMAKKAGFKVEKVESTVSKRQLQTFELLLPLSLPSQLIKYLGGKRYITKENWFEPVWTKLLTGIYKDADDSNINILVVCKKPC